MVLITKINKFNDDAGAKKNTRSKQNNIYQNILSYKIEFLTFPE